jgi:hypothetical protein
MNCKLQFILSYNSLYSNTYNSPSYSNIYFAHAKDFKVTFDGFTALPKVTFAF